MTNYIDDETLRAKLLGETSYMSWQELERFFASGAMIYVCESLDLIDVATSIAKDLVEDIQAWMANGQVANVSDEQAQHWQQRNTTLWAVVVKPYILVQTKIEKYDA